MPVRWRSAWKPWSPPSRWRTSTRVQRSPITSSARATGSKMPAGRGTAAGWREARFGMRDVTPGISNRPLTSIQVILPVTFKRDLRTARAPGDRLPGPEADRGSPGGAVARGRKVRAPQGGEVANGDPGKPEGKRNRNHTADGRRSAGRERRAAWRHRQG